MRVEDNRFLTEQMGECWHSVMWAGGVSEREGREMKASIFFAWYDLWIGLFWDQKKQILYICPLPCVVIKVEFLKGREK